LILEIFDVAEAEARDIAAGLVLLAEGWGSPETAPHVDWSYHLKKDLGERLKWRSETERERFARDRRKNFKTYEDYIRRGKRP
jgi:hypothetical protein